MGGYDIINEKKGGEEMKIELQGEIAGIIRRFESAGHEAYVVGGSLRDAMLGREAYDTDMNTSALPEQTMELFSDMRVIPTGLKHGTVTLLTDGCGAVEITTFRTDGEYTDMRHPDSVSFTRSLEEDLARRDFTVNAMAYAPEKGLTDIFGGRNDLENRLIRCVGEPEKRFSEDALRILRAFRFSAQLGFRIEENTLRGALKLGGNLTGIARERICVELFKLLSSPDPSHALTAMGPLLGYILPEVEIDKDRFTLCARLDSDPISRLALLIFDSADPASVARSLRLSNSDSARLARLSRTPSYPPPSSEAAARRWLSLFTADTRCAKELLVIMGLVTDTDTSHSLRLVSEQIAASPCLTVADLAVKGSDLISAGIADGKMVGSVLRALLDAVIEDPEKNDRDRLLHLAKTM